MQTVKEEIITIKDSRKKHKKAPKFVPAGQTSQMIVGASNETDLQVIQLSDHFYKKYELKRVYYSGYVPMLSDFACPRWARLCRWCRKPPISSRLAHAVYGFGAHEIVEAIAHFWIWTAIPSWHGQFVIVNIFPSMCKPLRMK